MPIANSLRAAIHFIEPSRPLCRHLCQHALAKASAQRERQSGVIFEPKLYATTTYLPFTAAHPVAPHVAGARKTSWGAAATWGASAALSALRHDVPVLSAWVGTELWLSAAPTPTGEIRDEREEAITSPLVKLRRAFGVAAMGVALGVGCSLVGEFCIGSGQPQALDADGIEPTFSRWRRLGALGLARDSLLQKAERAHLEGGAKTEVALLICALELQMASEFLRLAAVVPIAASAAFLGCAFGIAGEALARLRFTWVKFRFDEEREGRPARIMSILQAEQLERIELGAVPLGELDDSLIAGPLVGALWKTLHQQSVEVGDNLWVEGLIGALGALQLYRALYGRSRGLGFLRRANASRTLRGTIALAGLWHMPTLAPGTRINVPWGLPLGFAHQGHRAPPPRGAEAEAYQAGMDVHERGRDPRARAAIRRLFALYPDVDVARELSELRRVMRNLAQEAGQQFRLEIHHAALALDDTQIGPYLPIGDPRNTLADGEGGAWRVRDILARIFFATQRLTSPTGDDQALREERAHALITALANCLEEGRARVCAPGQVQRMLMVLQGFVDGMMLDDFRLTVAAYLTMEYHALLHRIGQDVSGAELQAGFDDIFRAGKNHFNEAELEMLATQLHDLANYSHDTRWYAPRRQEDAA